MNNNHHERKKELEVLFWWTKTCLRFTWPQDSAIDKNNLFQLDI